MKRMQRMLVLAASGLLLAGEARAAEPQRPRHGTPTSPRGNVVVGLCDGETSVEVEGVREGEPLTREQAQGVALQLMTEWRRKNPQARWEGPLVSPQVLAQQQPHQQQRGEMRNQPTGQMPPGSRSPPRLEPGEKPPAPQELPPGTGVEQGAAGVGRLMHTGKERMQVGHVYKDFGPRDEALWRASTVEFVEAGNRLFHDAKRLGSPVAMSCDMCHPDAANTHPETYPKYQVQLGRVALLRDMINWCIENPVRARPLDENSAEMKALEAYILAQRKGVALEYARH
jgi:thiosulfate dehydrogenase